MQCVLCGRDDTAETQSDYLRTAYVSSAGLERGYFRPRLNEYEMHVVKSCGRGEQTICANRAKCRRRREKQQMRARAL